MVQETHSKIDPWAASHRPWSLPKLPWVMKQTWNDLLFAHYPVEYSVLRKLVPDRLPLDDYNGTYWVGLVPFHMSGIRLRGLPAIPGTDKFPELNVRTYVTLNGKPGVYFFSLDAAHWLAVQLAKKLYHLPYVYADMSAKIDGSEIDYSSTRQSDNTVQLKCSYRPISEAFYAEQGTFDAWMSERYCLYTLDKKGQPLRCDILHQPWQLQKAEAEFSQNTLLAKQGIQVENEQPVLHFSKKIDVRIWPLIDAK
ncbi:YqjF family protein [Radiobacillus sp. PE A8.2]|uniref:YqjF family protein n=1 Tax=Radiobacillus sp. PE A8.2 TaxID=3380349 RepID=UPI00388F0AAF